MFRASVEETDPGETITLEWMTTGAMTVTLWHLAPTDQFGRFWDVEASGTFDYEVNLSERNWTRFVLSIGDETGTSEMVTLSVKLRCPDTWFFEGAPDICPVTAPLYSDGAEQRFENGVMIWVEREDRIYVLFKDGHSPKWNAYADEWHSDLPESDPALVPPPGILQPVRGFGLVWREQPGVKERLGWATGQEKAFDTVVQRTSYAKYNETYLRALDGKIWQLLPERSGWEKIPG